MITTTLNRIRKHGPCEDGWRKLLKHLDKTVADDEPLPLLTILESNGLDDTLWCLRSVPEHDREWRLFAIWCARRVQHLITNPRSVAALDVAERFANDMATQNELDSAWAAAWAAWSAVDAAGAAVLVALTASGAAALAAALAAARSAAAVDAEWYAERDAQKAELIRLIS